MTKPTQTFTIADPRTFEGDPYEVAERAARQAGALARLLGQTIDSARIMARNAQMERDLALTGECDAPGYDESAEGRRFADVRKLATDAEKNLAVLARAARFNPKAPLGAE